MITTSAHSLTFGPLDFLGVDKSAGWWIEATGEDASWGNPEAIVRALTSFLIDGATETTESYGNRQLSLKVRLTGTTSANLAAAEAALVAEVGKRNLLTWTPPDSTGDFAGTPSVFEVVNSSLDFNLDDVKELLLQRIYTLTIKALPWARAADPFSVTTTAPVVTTPAATVIDQCTATTNWAVTTSGGGLGGSGLSVDGGTRVLGTQPWGKSTTFRWLALTRSSLSQSMTATPFLRIKMFAAFSGEPADHLPPIRIDVLINGVLTAPVAQDGDYYWYLSPVTTITSVAVKPWARFPTQAGSIYMYVDELARTDTTTLSTSAGQRQQFLTLAVPGSVRTQGNLIVQHASTALGSTLVYTCLATSRAGQPPLRRLRTAGSTETTDTSLVAGKYSNLSTLHTFDIPAPNVPLGGYVLMARIRNPSGTAYSLTWAGKSLQGSTALDANPPSGAVTGTLTGSNTWNVVTVGHMTLPTTALGPSGLVRIELQSTGAIDLDEAWLFNLDEGRLTVVECGTSAPAAGGSSNYLFIDAPTLTNPTPAVAMGTQSDRSDSYGAASKMLSFGRHEFAPPTTSVFVVTTNCAATFVNLSGFARYHTHVAG